MATQSLAVYPLAVNTKLVKIQTPGRAYSYELTYITPRCIVLTAQHTGAVRQFRSQAALNIFLVGLRTHLRAKELNSRMPQILNRLEVH